MRISATDTGDSWHVTLGRATGVDPDDGDVVDEPAFQVAGGDDGQRPAPASAAPPLTSTAGCGGGPRWASLDQSGDSDVLAAIGQAIDSGLQ